MRPFLWENTWLRALTAIGAAAGGATLIPIILGALSGIGLILQGVCKIKGYSKKVETTRFAYTSYKTLLIEIREHLRTGSFSKEELLKKILWMDSEIVDLAHTPLVDKFKSLCYEVFDVPVF